MITFGSPLDGARVANAVIAGTPITQFFTQSVENLRRGPIAYQAMSKWFKFRTNIRDVVTGGGLSVLIRSLATGPILDITDELAGGLQLAIQTNFNPNDPSIRDLAENSNYFNTIRNFSNNKPKIFVHGDEDSPVHARMFISGITFDENFSNLLLAGYNGVAIGYRIASDGVNTSGSITCWKDCKDKKRRLKEAWYAGYDYLNRGWEVAWNQLTGARYLESYTSYEDFYECGGGGSGPLRPQPIMDDPECRISCGGDCWWVTRPVTRTRWVNSSSDGFIKRSSQVAQVSKWGGQEARLPGANHLEMGVHPNTNPLLRNIFNGLRGEFFRTNSR